VSELRDRLHDALDAAEFSEHDLLRQARGRLDAPAAPRQFQLAPVGAAAIALAVVVTLVAVTLNRPAPSGPSVATAAAIDNLIDYGFASPAVAWVHVHAGADVIARTADGGRSWHQVLSVQHLFPGAHMQIVDETTAVLYGSRTVAGTVGPEIVVWKTTDAGARWQSFALAPELPNLLGGVTGYFLDAGSGWLFASRLNCGGSMACAMQTVVGQDVYRTVDGGATWTETSFLENFRSNVASASFATPSIGLVVGQDGSLRTTTDGGSHWTSAAIPLIPPHCVIVRGGFCDVYFETTARMFPSGEGVAYVSLLLCQTGPSQCDHSQYQTIARARYRTDDAGVTWNREFGVDPAYDLVTPVDAAHAFAFGPPVVAGSDDGGSTWKSVGTLPMPAGWFISSAGFTDGTHGWAVTVDAPTRPYANFNPSNGKAQVLATSDGGASWRQVNLPLIGP